MGTNYQDVSTRELKFLYFEHNKKYCSVHSKTLNKSLNFYANETNKSSIHSARYYILGTVDYFKKKGFSISSFHLEISSNLPIGAEPSSSALISAVAKSLINLFEFKLNKEHIIDSVSYVGSIFRIKAGIMDQFTISWKKII